MDQYLCYKAGNQVIDLIRDNGLAPGNVRVFAGPAGGPKWFVSVGFDNLLMKTRFLENGNTRTLLAGSSAGAWRCTAMCCKDPISAYEKLRIAYSRNVFTRDDTQQSVSRALEANVSAFISDDDIDHVVNNPHYDIAIHTVRSKGPASSENRRIQGTALLGSAFVNALTVKGMDLFFRRTIFYSGPKPAFAADFNGELVPLTAKNLRKAALATGSLPYLIAGVRGIDGAPSGVYRDGGLSDYQLNQDYRPDPGITLFFHYQERIVPGWFDKHLSWRKPADRVLERVLQVYPGPRFMKLLPDKRLPDRDDFKIFVDDPSERIRRWDETSKLSYILGEEFFNAVESGAIRRLVKPL